MTKKILFAVVFAALAVAGARAGWMDALKSVSEVVGPSKARKTGGESAAVRGLSEGGTEGSDKRDFKAVDALDSKIPSDSEVEKFVKEGGLE